YARLSDYFVGCVQRLIKESAFGSKAVIVCYPKNTDAPYQTEVNGEGIEVLARNSLSGLDVSALKPDIVYISGWADKDYNRLATSFVGRVPVVMGLDNPWKGTVKQKLASL